MQSGHSQLCCRFHVVVQSEHGIRPLVASDALPVAQVVHANNLRRNQNHREQRLAPRLDACYWLVWRGGLFEPVV